MNKRISTLLLSLVCATATYAEEIRMAASDLLAEFITPTLKTFAEENNLDLKIQSIGSLPALDRLGSDEIDLAIIAIPEDDEVPRDQFNIYPFAYDSAVIAVNNSNPIDEISIPRLGGIFGSNEEFNFNTWGELGLSGWGSRNIKPLAGPTEESISLELFRYSVFAGGAMKPSVAVVRSNEIEEALAGNIAAIGVLSSLPKNKNLKVLMISETDAQDSPAYGPTADNIHYGDYPIRLAFYIAYNPRDEEKIKPVLRALFGEEVAAVLNKNYLFALPENVRTQLLIDLNFQQ
jgi:phosphate transport system substrate-binding protein